MESIIQVMLIIGCINLIADSAIIGVYIKDEIIEKIKRRKGNEKNNIK